MAKGDRVVSLADENKTRRLSDDTKRASTCKFCQADNHCTGSVLNCHCGCVDNPA